ncbi:hypothetical protein N7492_006303 [Penicillium capsulatum]|uniref:Uncharacterized protein n=1 Tax=Penicillium capsulatum TaxID=69766 RepID=A0A9W9I6Q7_9EURO|nr:hypothetical protein N7492_006303 [Penicillium capsulatum]KAJ6108953.1 hypothetical protein N7512_008790 [Penicillium capsulatum]
MNGTDSQDTGFSTDPLIAAAKVGALSGGAGLIYGGVAGVIRSPNPVIHSISCGIHWFGCGSTYWWLRSNIIKHHFQGQASPQERSYVSALCGGISGGVVTRLMGGRLIPGLVIFSLLGYSGQSAFNRIDAWQMEKAQSPSKPLLARIAESKWIPLRHLSDEEYRAILSEKLLGIEAEIALLDEKIADLEATRPDPASPTK